MHSLEDMKTKKLRLLPELLKPVYLVPRYFHRSVLSQGFQPDKECCGGFPPNKKHTLFVYYETKLLKTKRKVTAIK